MTPDDPRHGTPAGYIAHMRAGHGRACDPCVGAKNRTDKLRRYYGSALTDLTPEAWAIVRDNDLRLVARTTGVSECALKNIRDKGGQLRVYRQTLDRILDFAPVTDVGIRRRVRALAALGWTARDIGPLAGVHHEAILKLQRPHARSYVCRNVRDGVVAAYERLHMRRAPRTRWSTATARKAMANGWAPPLAWECIDTDPAPTGVKVDHISATARANAERLSALRDLDAWGENVTQACRRLGVKRDALERWCARHELADLFSRLVEREAYREPMNTFGGVA